MTQSSGGRMKPLSSLNMEIIQKLSGKASLFGMTADQLVLGILSKPDVWKDVKMIKIQTPKLKKFLGVDEQTKYIAFSEVFRNGEYLLAEEAEKALQTKPIERGTYERDIIKVDEKLNFCYDINTLNESTRRQQYCHWHCHRSPSKYTLPSRSR